MSVEVGVEWVLEWVERVSSESSGGRAADEWWRSGEGVADEEQTGSGRARLGLHSGCVWGESGGKGKRG